MSLMKKKKTLQSNTLTKNTWVGDFFIEFILIASNVLAMRSIRKGIAYSYYWAFVLITCSHFQGNITNIISVYGSWYKSES
jgi:hypothetical protein